MPRLAPLLLSGVLCACLAACGSSGSPASDSSTAASAGSGTRAAELLPARVEAAKCMRGQGIDLPDPTASAGNARRMLLVLGGYPQVKVEAAEKACATEIAKAFPNAGKITSGERTKKLQAAEAFSQCMNAHGISFPDPSTIASDPLSFYRGLSSLDTSSPAVKAAGTTCKAQALKDTGGG